MAATSLIIYDYLDYREYLRDSFLEQKRKHYYYSFRFVAQKTGADPAHIARVFKCTKHLSEKSSIPFIELFKLTDEETRYFKCLYAYNTARNQREEKRAFEDLMSCTGVHARSMNPEQYQFYTKWYYTAIRAVIAIKNFSAKEYTSIANSLSPRILPKEAKEGVALLLKLGLIIKGSDGTLQVADKHITTGSQWRSLAVSAFQKETIRLAEESLERHNRDVRDISTVTIGIKRSRMEEMRMRIAEFRASIMHMADEDDDPDEIYQLNIQLFPLTDCSQKESIQ
jgi:uncharacterized protein (TIGR02147 family)